MQVRLGIRFSEIKKDSGIRVAIDEVMPGSPAEISGLHSFDIIKVFNGADIHSSLDLIDAIRDAPNFQPMPVVIERHNQEKTFVILINEAKTIKFRVHRRENFDLFWYFCSYDVIVNGLNLGSIKDDETANFFTHRAFDRRYTIYFKATAIGGITNVTDTAVFQVRDDYDVLVTFTGGNKNAPMSIQSLVTEKKQSEWDDDELNKREHATYRRITSDSSVAPLWFKNATRKSLTGILKNKYRFAFYAPLVQCNPVYRMLGLLLLSYLILLFYLVLLSHLPNRLKKRLSVFVPLLTICLYFVVMVLTNLLNVVLFQGNRYLPFEFVLFCGLGLGIIILILVTIKPFYEALTEEGILFKKMLGYIGLFLEIVGMIFTIIEIFKIVENFW